MSDSVSAYAQFLTSHRRRDGYFTDSPAIGGWGNIALHGNGVYAPSLNADGTHERRLSPGRSVRLELRRDGRLHEVPGVPGFA